MEVIFQMKKNLGFKCDCGHIVFASTDYFGEQVKCDKCSKWLPIPLGFYNRIPLHLYRWIVLVFVIFLSTLYLKYGYYIGCASGWTMWMFPLWVGLIVIIFCNAVSKALMFMTFSNVMKRDPYKHRGLIAAIGGDDISLYVPVITYLLLALVYIINYSSIGVDLISFIRNPWLFMVIGAVFAAVFTTVLSWMVFRFAPRRLKRFL